MDKKAIYQAAALAAVVALIGVLVQLVASSGLPNGVQAQPAIPLPANQFVQAGNTYPDTVLGFFSGDSLFILGYILVFLGLYTVSAERARPFAMLGMSAGILTGLLDALENAFFITYALSAKAGTPMTTPDQTLYIVTNLKWMAAFATLFAFGVAFPRRTRFEQIIAGLMLLFPLVGVFGVANPALIAVRGLFFLIGMPVFAAYFWHQSQQVVN